MSRANAHFGFTMETGKIRRTDAREALELIDTTGVVLTWITETFIDFRFTLFALVTLTST
jgi:hypothetical protein